MSKAMKILWVSNTIFPDAATYLGQKPTVYGGWMYGLATELSNDSRVEIAVASVYPGESLKSFSINSIKYFLIPKKNKNFRLDCWLKINCDFSPDLVHIHGTEFGHGMELMNVCPSMKYVVSIQGLVSVYYRYFFKGMNFWDVLSNITFRDVIRLNTLFHAKFAFYKQGLIERDYIKRAAVVIGRTDWDCAHAWAVNPEVNYNFCNESLRDEFYSGEKWSLRNCCRYSLFLSQAAYPIKGLHQVLKAVALLKDKYPDIVINIAGHDIINNETLNARLKRGGYGSYIASIIQSLGLERHVVFLGPLNAGDIKMAYLRAHVFVCPSSIENSPNSLGEAQILGVPCIATSCGGIPTIVKDGVSALLYPFDEYEMLASKIDRLFCSDSLCEVLCEAGKNDALHRHNRSINLNRQVEIYENAIKK